MRFCAKPLFECGLGMFYAYYLWAQTPSLIIIRIHQHYKQLATYIVCVCVCVCVLLIKPCFFITVGFRFCGLHTRLWIICVCPVINDSTHDWIIQIVIQSCADFCWSFWGCYLATTMWSIWRCWWMCWIDMICLRKATEMFLEAVFTDVDWYWEISESWLISCYPTHQQHTRELRDWGYCPPEALSQTQNILAFIWSHTTQPDIIFTNSCVLATSKTDSLRTRNYVPMKRTKYFIVKSFVEVFFRSVSLSIRNQ